MHNLAATSKAGEAEISKRKAKGLKFQSLKLHSFLLGKRQYLQHGSEFPEHLQTLCSISRNSQAGPVRGQVFLFLEEENES